MGPQFITGGDHELISANASSETIKAWSTMNSVTKLTSTTGQGHIPQQQRRES